MKRRIVSVGFAVSLFFTCTLVAANHAAAAPTPDICFTFDTEAGAIIDYDHNNPACPKDVEIPSSIDGVTVTAITGLGGNQGAFHGASLTSVSLPNTITLIGDYAFTGNMLTSVDIPDSVITISHAAFAANLLTSVTIPSSVTTISDGAFIVNDLTDITIPNSVTYLSGFAGNRIESIFIPSSVTAIGAGAFANNLLTSVDIPDSVITIGDGAFSGNQLTSVSLSNALTLIDANAFSTNKLTSVAIPNSVTTIGDSAFAFNQITTITIPSTVATIASMTFVMQTIPGGTSFIDAMMSGGDPVVMQAFMDSIIYTQLYTASPDNPHGLSDAVITEASLGGGDINGNGNTADALGGHIVNPGYVTATYKDANSDALLPSQVFAGDGLASYLAKDNQTNDPSLYYRAGDTRTFVPPAVTGYQTPSPVSVVLAAGNNLLHFVYAASVNSTANSVSSNNSSVAGSSAANPAAPKTGLAPFQFHVVGILISISVFALLYYYMRRLYRKVKK